MPEFISEALEVMSAAVDEYDTTARDEITCRFRDEDFALMGEGGDATCDMHGETGNVMSSALDLPRVDPRAHRDAG